MSQVVGWGRMKEKRKEKGGGNQPKLKLKGERNGSVVAVCRVLPRHIIRSRIPGLNKTDVSFLLSVFPIFRVHAQAIQRLTLRESFPPGARNLCRGLIYAKNDDIPDLA